MVVCTYASHLRLVPMQQCSIKTANGVWILAATTLASSTAFIMGTAISVAAPSIQHTLEANLSSVLWVANAQLLLLGSLLLIGGSLGDYFGQKRIFIIGLVIQSTGAVLSGFAPNVTILIIFQAFQGIGSALMVPQSLAIINKCFPEKERGQAIGLWAGISGGISTMGPFIAGLLVDAFSWRAVFFMILPVTVISIIITVKTMPMIYRAKPKKLDWPGTFLAFIFLLGLIYGLISGPSIGWTNPIIVASLAISLAAIIAFILVESRRPEPLVPFAMFRNKLVTGANLATLFLYFALSGTIFFTVLNLQQAQGYSAALAGLALLPANILITVFSGPAGALADRVGPRLQMILGPALAALGMGLLATAGIGANYWLHFFPGLFLLGAGMSLVIAPLTKSALAVKPDWSGLASGFNNAVSRIAGLLALAILGIVMTTVFISHLDQNILRTDLNTSQQGQIISQADKLGGITVPSDFSNSAQNEAKQAIEKSFVSGYQRAMIFCAVMAALAAIASATTIKNQSNR